MAILQGLAAALMVLVAPAAMAADAGQARLGGDYAQFHIGGDDWRPCEQECKTDASCRSWTYITRMGQCRLKNMVPPAIANACCVSGVKEEKAAANGDEDECVRFANEAVDAANDNLRLRCGLTGQSWSTAYDEVYARCLDSSPRRRARETGERHQAMQACRQTADQSGRLVCDHYARMAVAENVTNTQNNCGFAGPGWSADPDQHRRYCREAQRASVGDQIASREHQLLECLGRGGNIAVADPECEAFSSRSVSQFGEASRRRCGDGFSGPGWSADAGAHYRWCKAHGQPERDAMLRQRQDALDGCGQIRIDLNKIFKF